MNTWAVGDLVQVVNEISDSDVSALVDEYESSYRLTAAGRDVARDDRRYDGVAPPELG